MGTPKNRPYIHRRRAAGLCNLCDLPAVTKAHCQKHREEINARSLKAALVRIARRRAEGKCAECEDPALEGYTRCELHLDTAKRNTANARARREAACAT